MIAEWINKSINAKKYSQSKHKIFSSKHHYDNSIFCIAVLLVYINSALTFFSSLLTQNIWNLKYPWFSNIFCCYKYYNKINISLIFFYFHCTKFNPLNINIWQTNLLNHYDSISFEVKAKRLTNAKLSIRAIIRKLEKA